MTDGVAELAGPETSKREYRRTAARDVFAIDRLAFELACDRGLNAAVAYLVIAQGTLGDNRTSRWSVAAIERHTGIGRRRARAAIDALLKPPALVEIVMTSNSRQAAPKYRLLPASTATEYRPNLIWLPKRIIAGTKLIPLRDGEIAPVELIRQTQSLLTLKLFILLYAEQNLVDSGGIEWRPGLGIWTPYKREVVGGSAQFTVLGFRPEEHWASAEPKFQTGFGLKGSFWDCFTRLRSLGLVEKVDHLVEGHTDEAEVIFPLAEPGAGRDEEQALRRHAIDAARGLLNERRRNEADEAGLILVPVLHQFAETDTLVGIWRLRYLPWTQQTVDWIAKVQQMAGAVGRIFQGVTRQASQV